MNPVAAYRKSVASSTGSAAMSQIVRAVCAIALATLHAACASGLLDDVREIQENAVVKTPTVTIGAQSNSLLAGTGGIVTYEVSTTEIAEGTRGSIAYCDSAGERVLTEPSGITNAVSAVASQGSTVTITVSAAASPGTYYFQVGFSTASSAVATLMIHSIGLGSQSGTIVDSAAGSATYSVTTVNVPDGEEGTIAWYSDSSGATATEAPEGITPTVTAISGGAATVTMSASSACLAGLYYFTLTEGAAVSSICTLAIVCAAPSGLSTVGADSTVSLTWTPVDGAATYAVYRSTTAGARGSQIDTAASAAYADSSASNNTRYYYEVAALNEAGESAPSAQVWGLPHVPPAMSRTTPTNYEGVQFYRDSSSRVSYITSFYMSKFEVTGALYAAVTGLADPSYFSSVTDHPVEQVSWFDALAFCNLLSLAEGRTPVYTISGSVNPEDWGSSPTDTSSPTYAAWNAVSYDAGANGYRLPTEMEFFWAEMGGLSDKISSDITNSGYGYNYNSGGYLKDYSGSSTRGGIYDHIDDYVWYSVNSGSATHAVGTKSANELGIYDLSGNVWEWCWDRWSDESNEGFTAATGSGILSDYWGSSDTNIQSRALRGKSYVNGTNYMYLQYRAGMSAYTKDKRYGFRVVYR